MLGPAVTPTPELLCAFVIGSFGLVRTQPSNSLKEAYKSRVRQAAHLPPVAPCADPEPAGSSHCGGPVPSLLGSPDLTSDSV